MKPIHSSTWMKISKVFMVLGVACNLLVIIPLVGIFTIATREPYVDAWPLTCGDHVFLWSYLGVWLVALIFVLRKVLKS